MCTVCICALYVCANSSRLLHAEILSDILATASFVPPHMPPFITMQWFTWSRRMCTGYLESIHSSTAILYSQSLYAIIHPKVTRDINILMYVCIYMDNKHFNSTKRLLMLCYAIPYMHTIHTSLYIHSVMK